MVKSEDSSTWLEREEGFAKAEKSRSSEGMNVL